MNRIKSVLKYIITFILTLAILTAFIVSSACIPRNTIRNNMQESAEYMCFHPTSFLLIDFIHASQMDRYADCITLSIAYYLDENHPVESAMWTSFHGAHTNLMNEYFRESVTEDVPADQEYLRYWHGSAAVIRFLHLYMNVRQIYIRCRESVSVEACIATNLPRSALAANRH